MDLQKHGERVTRLKEIDSDLARVRDRMNQLVASINELLREVVHRGPDGMTRGFWTTCRARIQVYAGVVSVRFSVGREMSRKLTTRSNLVEDRNDGAGLQWIVHVEDEKKMPLLKLDQERRILNHQYRTLFAERKSLRQLHGEEQVVKAGLL